MSHSVQAGERLAMAEDPGNTEVLRRLYYVRFAFAIVWAGLFVATSSTLTAVSVALLVIYPLFDAGAALFDSRSSGAARPRVSLHVNLALSLVAAIALAIASATEIPSVLRVWGAWAITAGIVQLIVAVQRYRLAGQRAMILSGGISVVAGAAFILMAAGPTVSLTGLAGYATLGGVFFLISAIRLRRGAQGRVY